jgi:hypothetical protein
MEFQVCVSSEQKHTILPLEQQQNEPPSFSKKDAWQGGLSPAPFPMQGEQDQMCGHLIKTESTLPWS